MSSGFDVSWDRFYKNNTGGLYPNAETVRWVARNYYGVPFEQRKLIRFLDLGCGGGAVSWYLAREGFNVFGVDGSSIAVKRLSKRFEDEKLNGCFRVCDFTKNISFDDGVFDVVMDVTSIQQNTKADARKAVKEVFRVLRYGGRFFSIIMSDETVLVEGENVSEKGTLSKYSKDDVLELFGCFNDLVVEKKLRTDNNSVIVNWIVSGVKLQRWKK